MMDIDGARPEAVERYTYKSFVIEVELYKRRTGGYYAWPYVEKSRKDGLSKRHFHVSNPEFPTIEAAVDAVLKEGRSKIDNGFDPEWILDFERDFYTAAGNPPNLHVQGKSVLPLAPRWKLNDPVVSIHPDALPPDVASSQDDCADYRKTGDRSNQHRAAN